MSPLVAARKLGWFVKSAVLGQITVKGWDRYFPMDRHERGSRAFHERVIPESRFGGSGPL